MREVGCLCGERIVFLAEEVRVKTCPNCGASVHQGVVPRALQETVRYRPRLGRPAVSRYWLGGVLAIVLLAAVIITALSVARTKALARASLDERRAEAARLTGDLYIAAEAYGRALKACRKWGSGSESVARMENALAEVEAALAQSEQTRARTSSGVLPISLEELARQAYMNGPDTWQGDFQAGFAGRWVILQGTVVMREGAAYKASALTVSYRVFSPEGRAVEISFDEPFFELRRLGPGEECLVKAVLAEMAWERGTSAEAGRWVLVMDGSASELVTDTDDLRTIGWEVDERLRELVGRQLSLSAAF